MYLNGGLLDKCELVDDEFIFSDLVFVLIDWLCLLDWAISQIFLEILLVLFSLSFPSVLPVWDFSDLFR